ncbi:Thiamine pyrophosphokinase [Alteracholeplasma palmae J233]|uniref:Thiamine diphosphokinase n=1 Tax=Alteracholeplasma palmae (strain ATCC 49389 / J233) TaxID=1318466 RepID=U4KRA3_ALTPJ|nr:thiamine diphosphokinase [Alteracholeplasma palmae]CCV63986.1 Thiamine pyrophosphokinase [Alteracholeplasma palmae J233]
MLKIVYVIAPPIDFDLHKIVTKNSFVIAVDSAVEAVISQNIPIDLAVGDFDSLKDKGLLEGLNVIKLNEEKDDTDTAVALNEAYKKEADYVYLVGGINGDRAEHMIANIFLLEKYPKLEIKNDHMRIKKLPAGSYDLSFKGYISLFGFPSAVLSLEGFKYPLNRYKMDFADPVGISNELNDYKGKITILEGSVIVILSKKA